MKKSIIIGILLGFLTLTAGNIIQNGDFSAGVKHWTFASWLKTPGTRSVKKEGDVNYLSLTNNKSSKSSTMCLQQLKLKSDTTYIFKFRMRTKDVKRNLPNKITHGAGITVIDQKHLFAGAAKAWTMIEGTTGWTEYRGTFKTGKLKPGQLVSFYPTLSLATGTADFANISVEEADSGAAAAPVQKKK